MSDPRKMVRPGNEAGSTRTSDWDRFADEGSPLAAALAEDMKRLAAIGDGEFKKPSRTRIIAVANQRVESERRHRLLILQPPWRRADYAYLLLMTIHRVMRRPHSGYTNAKASPLSTMFYSRGSHFFQFCGQPRSSPIFMWRLRTSTWPLLMLNLLMKWTAVPGSETS